MDVMERARKLKDEGIDVVPVYGVGPDGQTCKCPEGRNCPSAGKHPVGGVQPDMRDGFDRLATEVKAGKKPNLGVLPHQSRLVIIDIDIRNGGDKTMAAFKEKYGPFPDTKRVMTGGGGWHYYFLAPEGVEWKAQLGEGIDIKHNGMVVAAGSRAAAHGRFDGEYREHSAEGTPIAEMPQWVIEEGRRKATLREAQPAPQGEVDPDDPDLPRRRRYVASGIERDLAKLDDLVAKKTDRIEDYKGPHWNNTLYAVACNVFELVNTPESEMTHEEAEQALFDRAPRDAGFTDRTVRQTINSARDGIGDTARVIPDAPIDPFADALGGDGDTPRVAALDRMIGRQWKDIDVAKAFAEHFVEEICFVEGQGWKRWSSVGGLWERVADDVVIGLSADFISEMVDTANQRRDQDALKKVSGRMSHSGVKNVVALARTNPALRRQPEDLDADPELFNCTNGYVDLRTGRLIAHNRDKMMTKSAGCAYRPGATHPDVDEALKALDPEERDWMQLAFGQALIGTPPKEDHLLLMNGGGSNGKSGYVESLMAVAGTYATTLSEKALMPGKSDHTTDLTDLLGVRVAVLEELPESGELSSRRIKTTVGTKTIKARKMHENNMEWESTHSIFITTNHQPRIAETDEGIWRRLALIVFPYHFVIDGSPLRSESDRRGDVNLRHRLSLDAQKEAFLAWVIEGARKYLALGDTFLRPTERMIADRDEWRESVDPAGRFLEEMVVFEEGYFITGNDLAEELRQWLGQNGHTAWSSTLMNARLEQHHAIISAGVKRQRVRVGGGMELSPRPGPVQIGYRDGQQLRGWTRMRWRTPADDQAVAS